MGDTVVRVENLGKKYIINHQQERYTALRDVIANKVKSIGKSKIDTGKKEEFWALKDVSFDIKQGDRVGIIGRNGAGKSTLLKVLSRITEPTTGSIALKGRVSSLLEVGTGFHPELTGRENIYLNGAILGMSRQEIKKKFDEIVEFAEVEKFLDTPVKRYSSGMYVRLAFSVAAHMEPEILIVDEVLAVGDAQFQKKCLGKMGDIGKGGRTVLFVSHNMGAIRQLCDRVNIFDNGKLVLQSNNVDEAIESYLTLDEETKSEWKTVEPNRIDNYWMSIIKFYAVNSKGEIITGAISNHEEIFVELIADIHHLDPGLHFGFILINEKGLKIFTSLTTDTVEQEWPKLQTGNIKIRAKLPQLFLNEGRYKFALEASIRCSEWIYNPYNNSPSFFLTIRSGVSESPYWTEKRETILAPVLKWEVK